MIKVGIIGGAGYTGGELIRLLIHHPMVKIGFVQSKSHADQPIYTVHQDLYGESHIIFTSHTHTEVDVIFFCTSHGETSKLIPSLNLPKHIKIIDLSNDFRIAPTNICNDMTFVYGLPEINKNMIAKASAVANPGCFATALQLAVLPLFTQSLTDDFYATAITGATGAGQGLSSSSHFAWRHDNIQAYKTLLHQHLDEILQSCQQMSQKTDVPKVHFVPWRGDFSRGIFASVQTKTSLSLQNVTELYKDFYKNAAFTTISDVPIHLKQVVNTNKCILQLEKVGDQLVIHSIIDNLLKGASGQAVQNMNLMFGLDENMGLKLKPSAF